jgi:hypothetical protein
VSKVNEKTLELNVGAEILALARSAPGCGRAYLRGLTQAEEKQEGIDFFAQLPTGSKLYLFQFKAVLAGSRCPPFKYTLRKEQHLNLQASSGKTPGLAFYVFPYYLYYKQLHKALPTLAGDTWLLDVTDVQPADFKTFSSRTVSCTAATAKINPEYPLQRLTAISDRGPLGPGINKDTFQSWYRDLRGQRDGRGVRGRRNPWLVRGLRALIVVP